MNITHEAASAAILSAVDEGRLIQKEWRVSGEDGRHLVCLLGSIDENLTSPADCSGDLMPAWLAELVPMIFDSLAKNRIYPPARRFGQLVVRWHVLTPAQWDAALKRTRIYCIDTAVDAARPFGDGKPCWPAIEAAYEQCRNAIETDDKEAAEAVAMEASFAAVAAMREAVDARAARVAWAAWAVAWAAEEGVMSAAGATAAASADARGVRAMVWDRIFTFVLDQIEMEVNA